jgi:hypothetical protein
MPEAAGHEQVDGVGRQVGVGQRLADRPAVAVAGRVGLGDAVRVLAGAEADELGVDFGAAGRRVFVLLEDEQPAALGGGGAVGVGVERADGRRGAVVVRLRTPLEQDLPHVAHRHDLRLGPAADRQVGRAALDRAERLADRPGGCSRRRTVIVFDGPFSSWMIVTWHASMFGRYFSSHSGVSWLLPSRPHRWRSSLLDDGGSRHAERGRQLVKIDADEARPDVAAEAVGVDRRLVGVGLGLGAPRP